MLLAGVLAFAGFLLLSAYAPDMRVGSDGGAHPLSRAATGYSGIVRLIGDMGGETLMVRDPAEFTNAALLVVTLAPETDRQALADLVAQRSYKVTLFVLPKWQTLPLPANRSWVQSTGSLGENASFLLKPLAPLKVRAAQQHSGRIRGPLSEAVDMPAPRREQYLEGAGMKPLLMDSRDRPILAHVEGTQVYILSDPDLIANHGLKDPAVARGALRMLAHLRPNDEPIMFDLTLHGFARTRSLLKLIFEPPFLALTLALFAAALLAGLHAIGRFGPPKREARAIPFGKQALVDNAAGLIRRAGRERRLGERYLLLVRDHAKADFAAPATLVDEELDHWLDGIGPPDGPRFSELAAAAREPRTGAAMLIAAQALFNWRKDVTRDR
jgi:hypothetical protein